MSDQDTDLNEKRAEEHRILEERKAFNYSLAGKADAVGIIAKGSAGGTVVSDIDNKKKKEKKFLDALLENALNTPEDIDNLLDDMGKAVKAAQDNFNKAKAYKSAYESGDLNQMLLLLKQDGVDTTGFSKKDISDKVRDQYADHASDYNQNKDFVTKGSENIQNSDVSSEEQKNQAIKLEEIADMGELEATLDENPDIYLKSDQNIEFETVDTKVANEEIASDSNFSLDSNEPSNDAFAEFSNEGSLTTSFAKSVTSDPFAETAAGLSDPFNEVANGLEITPKMQNDLNIEVEHKVDIEAPKTGL